MVLLSLPPLLRLDLPIPVPQPQALLLLALQSVGMVDGFALEGELFEVRAETRVRPAAASFETFQWMEPIVETRAEEAAAGAEGIPE